MQHRKPKTTHGKIPYLKLLKKYLPPLACAFLCLIFQNSADAKVTFSISYKTEFGPAAIITGYDTHQNILWTKTVPNNNNAYQAVWNIGEQNGQYYYEQNGEVIALDAQTGDELWRNTAFITEDDVNRARADETYTEYNVSPYKTASCFDAEGNIYLGASTVPQLFVIARDGKTLGRVDTINPAYKNTQGFWYMPDGTLAVKYYSIDTASPQTGGMVNVNPASFGFSIPQSPAASSPLRESPMFFYGDHVDGGSCGENVYWHLYEDKIHGSGWILEISGNGSMYNYNTMFEHDLRDLPYASYYGSIREAVIMDGVETVGSGAFLDALDLENAFIGKDVSRIQTDAFYNCRNLRSVALPARSLIVYWGAFNECPSLPRLSLPAGSRVAPYDSWPYAVYELQDRLSIEDPSSNVILSSEKDSVKALCAYGDGFYLLYCDTSGFYEGEKYYTIVNAKEGTVVFPKIAVRGNKGFWAEGLEALRRDRQMDASYCGDGVFYIDLDTDNYDYYNFYNCYTGDEFRLPQETCFRNARFDGSDYIAVMDTDVSLTQKCYILSPRTGLTGTIEAGFIAISRYSDGGFIYATGNDLRFYDCASGETNSICPDGDKVIHGYTIDYVFIDGQAAIRLRGDDGKTYEAVVDKRGNYITPPHAVS